MQSYVIPNWQCQAYSELVKRQKFQPQPMLAEMELEAEFQYMSSPGDAYMKALEALAQSPGFGIKEMDAKLGTSSVPVNFFGTG